MGAPYKAQVAPLAASAIGDLLTGTVDAATTLRDVIDAKIKVGGVSGEMVSDIALAQFPVLWGVLVGVTSAELNGLEIDAEGP